MSLLRPLPVDTGAAATPVAPRPLRLIPGSLPISLPKVRPVSNPRKVMSLPAYVAMLTVVMLSAMLGSLVINTVLTQGAFALQDTTRQAKILRDQHEELTQSVAAAESPVAIEQKARSMGMVPAASPVFLRLADKSVLGEPVAAKRDQAAGR